MPFVSPGSVDNAPGQAQKLKLTGHTQLSGRLSSHDNVKIGNATGSFFEGMLWHVCKHAQWLAIVYNVHVSTAIVSCKIKRSRATNSKLWL